MPKFLQNYSKEFIYLIIYINNKYRQHLTLFFLLLLVTCYQHVFWDCVKYGIYNSFYISTKNKNTAYG